MYRFTIGRPRGFVQWFIASIVAFWLLQFGGALIPASIWYEVGRVEVIEPVYEGDEIRLQVSRKVNREFDGEYDVVIINDENYAIVCENGGSLRYSPERSLPDPLPLVEWWLNDPTCELPAGDYHMETRWKIEWSPFELLDKRVKVMTYFTVLPAESRAPVQTSEPLLGVQLEMLQQQVQELSNELEVLK